MLLGGVKASVLLFVGDIAIFALALLLTLLIRYRGDLTPTILHAHTGPFAILFALWALIFYLSGLYGKRIVYLKANLANALVRTQIVNIVLAALFFFLFPVGIAPKTNLVIYLVVSLALILFWRLSLYPRLSRRALTAAALLAEGKEAEELVAEARANPRYGLDFRLVRPLSAIEPAVFERELESLDVRLVIVDTSQEVSPELSALIYKLTQLERRLQFASFEDAYEEIFDRIPLSRLAHIWFLENVAPGTSALYALTKRLIDIAGGIVMGLIALVAIPLIFLADVLEDSGPLFIEQERFGQGGKLIRVYKFRTMEKNDGGAWAGENGNRVTPVVNFLRKTSLDEFPQFLNVLSGELSLIGPRNDIRALGDRLASALPYYEARYLVKPGITGWAQVNQQYEPGNASPQSVEETKVRLAYDFYYLKHRSLGLDLVIALKTIKRMFFRVSSW
ncbi:MAG: sugar transferase [Minisyncoccia bacterium]